MSSPDTSSHDSEADRPLQDALTTLDRAQRDLSAIRLQVAQTIEETLNNLTPRSCGSATANKTLVDRVNELLRNHAMRLVCPRCSASALLFLQTRGAARHGSFQFQHSLGSGRHTRHGGSKVMPKVSVVPIVPKAIET